MILRNSRAATLLAALVLSLGGLAAAQEELSVSIGAGGLLPTGELYRGIYGTGFAGSAEVWLKFKGPLGLVSGFDAFLDDGTAVPQFEGDVEEYPVRFRRWTVPILAFYQLDLKRVALRAGAGLAIHFYRETWRTVDFDHKGSGVGPRLLLAARIGISGRLSFLGSVAYDPFQAVAIPETQWKAGLGGFQVLGGLSFRLY
jgi:hypothetical protein